MKILWACLKPYRWLIALSLLLAAVAQLLNLVNPIIVLAPGELIAMQFITGQIFLPLNLLRQREFLYE